MLTWKQNHRAGWIETKVSDGKFIIDPDQDFGAPFALFFIPKVKGLPRVHLGAGNVQRLKATAELEAANREGGK